MAVRWVKNSWVSKVKKSTIQNCFRRVGFDMVEADEMNEDDIQGIVEFLALQYEIEEPHFEENPPVFNEIECDWEANVLDPPEEEDANEDDLEEENQLPLVSMEEMKQAWVILRSGIQQRPNSKLFDFISPINEAFMKDSCQSYIEKFLVTSPAPL